VAKVGFFLQVGKIMGRKSAGNEKKPYICRLY